ncbi:MAG: DUF2288 domain-containing protein [Halieaceae bacterium]|jgi:hypothetical protein|nr:DUF2288 domain-containing protein [Halieaceae bacterium]
MSDDGQQRLAADFHAQTARIAFTELQRFFAAGQLVLVAAGLDLVQVAVALAEDDAPRFERWIAAGQVAAVSDEQARMWLAEDAALWAVVAQPWVLVQEERDRALMH